SATPPAAKTSEGGFAPLPKPPPRIRLRRQKPPLEPRSLRPAWPGAGDVALQEVPRGQFAVACGRRPVAAAPRQVLVDEGSPRDDDEAVACDGLGGRAKDPRRERRRREAVLRGARAGAARGEEDVRKGRTALVCSGDLDPPDVGRALGHDARGHGLPERARDD